MTEGTTVSLLEVPGRDGESGTVHQYHFRKWPEQSTPSNVQSMLQFIRTVHAKCPRRSGPSMLVHCSAGVGRSGAFVAVDILLQRLARGQRDIIDIYGVVAQLRKQRMLMVHYPIMLKFVHQVVYSALQEQSNMGYMIMTGNSSNWALGSKDNATRRVAYINDAMDNNE